MKITIASDVDRDRLQAEQACDEGDRGYLYEDEGRLVVESYPRRDGQPWLFELDELVSSLMQARLDPTVDHAEAA